MGAWTDLLRRQVSGHFFLSCGLLDWVIALVGLGVRLGQISPELSWVGLLLLL